jgi:hypothetical protein
MAESDHTPNGVRFGAQHKYLMMDAPKKRDPSCYLSFKSVLIISCAMLARQM